MIEMLEPWWRFGVALLIGTLIGLEREFVQQRSGDVDFAGIRTFSLMSLLGSVAAFLSLQHGVGLFIIAYLALAALFTVSHVLEIIRERHEGITTEVAGLITPLLGAMVVWDLPEVAAALGVITALVLSLKPSLHSIARRMSPEDLRATLEFALITAVILPLIPNQQFGPFDVLNPFEIWLLVVLISGISFFGYVLTKVLGTRRGVGVMGLVGGLVSSTAVTLSFSGRSKENPSLSRLFVGAIALASCVLFPRVLVEVAVVNSALLPRLVPAFSAMLGVGLVSVYLVMRREAQSKEEPGVKLTNPLRLTTAIGFALLFSLVLMLVKGASEFYGDAGVYLASALTGLADVDALTLTAAELSAAGQLGERVASTAISLAVLVNTTVKAAMALTLGSKAMRRPVLWIFGLILVTGLATSAFTIWF